MHEIDQTQFDSITKQFKIQMQHANDMFDEISSTPSLQRVLTDVHVKAIGVSQSNWLKHQFKIDSGACGNLMPLCNKDLLASTVNSAVHLLDYNKQDKTTGNLLCVC